MPRPIWNGSISFGLVNVPVKLFTAVSEKSVRFHQLEEGTGSRIRYRRVSEETGEEVPYEKIVKGYELAKGQYVMVDREELDAVSPEGGRVIDIEDFVDLADIDPVYFNSTYYLGPPEGPGAKAYALLYQAMVRSNKAAVGRFVLRSKEYLAALRPLDGVLALQTMYFHDEIVDSSFLGDAATETEVSDRELSIAERLIESLTTDWEPERYTDTYREAVMDLIERKAEGQEIVAPAPAEETAEVIDLMAALEASLEERRQQRAEPEDKAPKKKAAEGG